MLSAANMILSDCRNQFAYNLITSQIYSVCLSLSLSLTHTLIHTVGMVLTDSIGLSSSETVGLILAVVSGGTILILIIFTITFVCR